MEEELDTLKKEQEDLLVLLADQDTKIDKYKSKLKELGQPVCHHIFFSLTRLIFTVAKLEDVKIFRMFEI